MFQVFKKFRKKKFHIKRTTRVFRLGEIKDYGVFHPNPYIRLHGKWLFKAGFRPEEQVIITAKKNSITVKKNDINQLKRLSKKHI
jgi:hypothetical protein